MSDFAIKVHGLGKRYRIGANQQAYRTLREKLNETALAPFRAVGHLLTRNGNGQAASGKTSPFPLTSSPLPSRASRETFWALKDVSFEVKRGEVVGIIGRNGAGKSTLLKILSRITEPTEGYADINGRIASLLEVGTGFHPELTGRENIFLNGSILGMKRVEINKKFDEIVAFAEIEKFIDTPVKHYSSGMYVRLAFAVAAHLDPEILLVDEVLAVGDAAFQKKCLGKMGDVAREGRTVLFVSHNLGQIGNLCSRGLYLENGRISSLGAVRDVITEYQRSVASLDTTTLALSQRRDGFSNWRIVGPENNAHTLVECKSFQLVLRLQLAEPVHNGYAGLVLHTLAGDRVAGWQTGGLALQPGDYDLVFDFSSLPVRPGVYYWYASLWDGSRRVDVAHLVPDLIIATKEHSNMTPEWAGIVNVPCDIEVRAV